MNDQQDKPQSQVDDEASTSIQEIGGKTPTQPTSIEPARSTKFSPECGIELNSKAEICPKCGVRQPTGQQQIVGKSPVIAVILTLLILPVGYWYIGRLKRGIVVTLIGLVLGALTGGIGGFIVLAVALYDAYKLVKNEPAPFDFLNRWDLG
jgi:hypothetical protein